MPPFPPIMVLPRTEGSGDCLCINALSPAHGAIPHHFYVTDGAVLLDRRILHWLSSPNSKGNWINEGWAQSLQGAHCSCKVFLHGCILKILGPNVKSVTGPTSYHVPFKILVLSYGPRCDCYLGNPYNYTPGFLYGMCNGPSPPYKKNNSISHFLQNVM